MADRRPTRRASREAVLYLTGGPGQGGTALVEDLADESRPLMRGRDLLALDTRGTGSSSDLVLCPEIQGSSGLGISARRASGCAARFGGAAGRYGTDDVVDDIEAVRRATGYDRLLVVAVSYGTFAAQRYAYEHPGRVRGLVLDSTLPVGPTEPYGRVNAAAVPRTISDVCRRGACRGVTRDARADLAATQARLPIATRSATPSGRRAGTVVDGSRLLQLAYVGDLDPVTRATVPAALRGARAGDPALLARLARDTGVAPGRSPEPDGPGIAASAAELNLATFFATTCRDTAFPWTAETPLGRARLDRARAETAAIDPRTTGGFDGRALLAFSSANACAGWPTGPALRPLGPTPDVPVLVLSGTADARTPLEDARRVAASYPRGRLVPVPGEGHSVLGGRSPCVRRAVRAFVAGRTPSTCRANLGPARALPVPPASARSLGATPRRRAVGTARAATHDVARQTVSFLLQALGLGAPAEAEVLGKALKDLPTVPGLRGGSVRFTSSGVRLVRYGYVGGTTVDGTLGAGRGRVTLLVRGRGVGTRRVRIPDPFASVDRLVGVVSESLGLPVEGRYRVRVAARGAVRVRR